MTFKQYIKERGKEILQGTKKATEKVSSLNPKKIGKNKLIKKGKNKVKEIKSSSLLKSFSNNSQVVKQVPERVYANDNRSLFFNKEMDKEIKSMRRF